MSGRSASVGGTLAGGIQDVAALLPLIGTEQCETHVGSALAGGYLYAAATPLSIFGSLGIVKAGMLVLFSSISISVPRISISFHSCRPTINISYYRKFLGARILENAGFKLTGTVAPLIAMDGNRFKAETRLLEILEEKHIDDPEKVSIDWKSGRWNIMLVITTILGAAFSITPYVALLLGPTSWRPTSFHLPWLFPALRIAGSCFAIVACQFIIQARAICLMKKRILFLTIHWHLDAIYKEGFHAWLKDSKVLWDPSLPAEQCLWSLQQHMSSVGRLLPPTIEDLNREKGHRHVEYNTVSMPEGRLEGSCKSAVVFDDSDSISTSMLNALSQTEERDDAEGYPNSQSDSFRAPEETSDPPHMLKETSRGSDHTSIQMAPSKQASNSVPPQASSVPPPASPRETLSFDVNDLHRLHQEHFPTSARDTALIVVYWVLLGLSLPATVAGYIGCFTLVSATPLGNAPLVWVALEAVLSIFRIVIWASNPSFDEETEVTVRLKLSKHQPMVTTDDYNPYIVDFNHEMRKPFTLLPEREFLQWITPFTGPLDQFQKADNITLYFTLTTQYENNSENFQSWGRSRHLSSLKPEFMSLFMTVFNSDMQIGVTSVLSKGSFDYFDVVVKYGAISRKLEASVQSEKRQTHPWRLEDDNLFDSLEKHYQYIIATLPRKWDLSQSQNIDIERIDIPRNPPLPLLTDHDQSYLDRGYEHELKTGLIAIWSAWIVTVMGKLQSHTRLDCHEAMRDVATEEAKSEFDELDIQLVFGWASRELVLLTLSLELEDTLRLKMETYASEVSHLREDRNLRMWINSEFESGRRKRLEQERSAAKERMETAMKDATAQASADGRQWDKKSQNSPSSWWANTIEFIHKQWVAGISDQRKEMKPSENRLKWMIRDASEGRKFSRVWHEHWRTEHRVEEQMMRAVVERIRIVPTHSTRKDMDEVYEYPGPDTQATSKFATLKNSSSKGQACSATVYNVQGCDKDIVYDVIAKRSTRSVVRVDPAIVAFIPPNDHLLYLGSFLGAAEPAFVQQNRERWWDQQTTDSSTFYFTPWGASVSDSGDSCYLSTTGTIAILLVFLTAPSAVQVTVLHHGQNVGNVSIQESGKELGSISGSDIPQTFQLRDFQPVVLQPGRHKLELVSLIQLLGSYFLRDILIEISGDPTLDFEPTEIGAGPEDRLDQVNYDTLSNFSSSENDFA